MPPPVVTFDAGQTLVDLDLDFLSTRLAERGIEAHAAALVHSAPAAWRVYDDVVARGGDDAWHAFMRALLVGGGVSKEVDELVTWLRGEQRVKNLWRKPIADMVTLARDLAAGGVRVAVVSNSEGHLAELLAEVGIAEPFEVVIDSTRVGVSKPDPRIFDSRTRGTRRATRQRVRAYRRFVGRRCRGRTSRRLASGVAQVADELGRWRLQRQRARRGRLRRPADASGTTCVRRRRRLTATRRRDMRTAVTPRSAATPARA